MGQRIPKFNLRHLNILFQISQTEKISLVAERVHLTKPSVYQAIKRLEILTGVILFERHGGGRLTAEGRVLALRAGKALEHLSIFNFYYDSSEGMSRNVVGSLLDSQLQCLIKVVRHRSFAVAAVRLGKSESDVFRNTRSLEELLNLKLFFRTAKAVEATIEARQLAREASLAYSEILQGLDEISRLTGRREARLSIGCLPTATAELLSESVTPFLDNFPDAAVSIVDGPYDELLLALLHGEIDMILGTVDPELMTGQVVHTKLFDDQLSLVMRAGHPAQHCGELEKLLGKLNHYGWIAPRSGTPSRTAFSQFFSHFGRQEPNRLLECNSLVVIRRLLVQSDRIAFLSKRQVKPEIESGLLQALDIGPNFTHPIGLVKRQDWLPSAIQRAYLDQLLLAARPIQSL